MSDFTKEELQLLANELGPWGNDYEGMQEEREDLLNKIQSMIENYCEHEWFNHCSYCNPLNIYCKNCKEYLHLKREENDHQ